MGNKIKWLAAQLIEYSTGCSIGYDSNAVRPSIFTSTQQMRGQWSIKTRGKLMAGIYIVLKIDGNNISLR